MDRKFQIGEIARFFDIPASTLRYWEDKGVLHPEKNMKINIGNTRLKI